MSKKDLHLDLRRHGTIPLFALQGFGRPTLRVCGVWMLWVNEIPSPQSVILPSLSLWRLGTRLPMSLLIQRPGLETRRHSAQAPIGYNCGRFFVRFFSMAAVRGRISVLPGPMSPVSNLRTAATPSLGTNVAALT